MSDSLTKDERFNEAEPIAPTRHPDETARRVNGCLVDINGWLLTPDEARVLRDWLNKVLP